MLDCQLVNAADCATIGHDFSHRDEACIDGISISRFGAVFVGGAFRRQSSVVMFVCPSSSTVAPVKQQGNSHQDNDTHCE